MSNLGGPEVNDGDVLSRRLSRRALLRLAGMGAGLALVPGPLAVLGGRMESARAATSAALEAPILSSGEYPIGLWWPPPPAETTAERYQEIARAGFNFVIGGNGVTNDNANPRALEAAAASNLRFLLTDNRLQRIIRDGSGDSGARSQAVATPSLFQYLLAHDEPGFNAEAVSDPKEEVGQRIRQLLQRYAGYPALAGLNLFDEPSRSMFDLVGFANEALQRFASTELPYVNVWPSYASSSSLGTPTYEEYLERYVDEVKPPLLSFDHYPLLSGTDITSDYFYNWAVLRKFSLQAGIPSWVFIQSVDFDGGEVGLAKRRRPNESEILWQVNVSLAYGAKGIQYFTYWTPNVPPGAAIQFGEALVSVEGRTTPLYGYSKNVNGYLRSIGRVILPLISESVVHAGEKILPYGVEAFEGDRYVRSASGSPVLLSRFRAPDGKKNERYLFVANRSFTSRSETELELSGSVGATFEFDGERGEFAPLARQDAARTLQPEIEPGGARLYLLRTNQRPS